jgi:hypothetical protein
MKQSLNSIQIQHFINQGFIKIENAFSKEIAEECRNILWKDTGCKSDDPSTWKQPVIRLGDYKQKPFKKVANSPLLHAAFDQLVGEERWMPRNSLGTFPIRFPGDEEPGDTGWHVDGSFPGNDINDFSSWRINIYSKGRALLMLFLFSDVAEFDAPTRIRTGSHFDVARLLEPAGEKGMAFLELAKKLFITEGKEEVNATGSAGTVYLCHPFLVHAAQKHRGNLPRFLAQPPLHSAKDFQLQRLDGNYSPVEIAIRNAIMNDTKNMAYSP